MNYVGAFMLTVSQERGAGAGAVLVLRALHAPAADTSSTAAKLSYKCRQHFSSDPFCVSGCCSRQHTDRRAEPCSLPGTTSVPEPRGALPHNASGASRLGLPFKAAGNFLTASPRTRDSHRKLHEVVCSKQTQIFINISENLNIGIYPHVCKHLAFLQRSESTHVFLVPVSFQLTDCSSKTSATISIMSKPR